MVAPRLARLSLSLHLALLALVDGRLTMGQTPSSGRTPTASSPTSQSSPTAQGIVAGSILVAPKLAYKALAPKLA